MSFDSGLNVVCGSPAAPGRIKTSRRHSLGLAGRQSADARGQAMEGPDVSGSSPRPPWVAEVTLVLDNSDRALPIDFSEVGITRRMYRWASPGYLINDAPAPLWTMQDILHD